YRSSPAISAWPYNGGQRVDMLRKWPKHRMASAPNSWASGGGSSAQYFAAGLTSVARRQMRHAETPERESVRGAGDGVGGSIAAPAADWLAQPRSQRTITGSHRCRDPKVAASARTVAGYR